MMYSPADVRVIAESSSVAAVTEITAMLRAIAVLTEHVVTEAARGLVVAIGAVR